MDYLPIFVGVTAAAVVIQAGILVGLFVAVRKSSSRMEALATEVKDKVMPTADTAHALLVDLRPKIDTIATNVSESTTVIRGEIERLDASVSDVVDRTRLQVIRADELISLNPTAKIIIPAVIEIAPSIPGTTTTSTSVNTPKPAMLNATLSRMPMGTLSPNLFAMREPPIAAIITAPK